MPTCLARIYSDLRLQIWLWMQHSSYCRHCQTCRLETLPDHRTHQKNKSKDKGKWFTRADVQFIVRIDINLTVDLIEVGAGLDWVTPQLSDNQSSCLLFNSAFRGLERTKTKQTPTSPRGNLKRRLISVIGVSVLHAENKCNN